MPTRADDSRRVGRVDEGMGARRTHMGGDCGDVIDGLGVDYRRLDRRMYVTHCVSSIDASTAYPSHEQLHQPTQLPRIRPRRSRRRTPANTSQRGSTPKHRLASFSKPVQTDSRKKSHFFSKSIHGFVSDHHHRLSLDARTPCPPIRRPALSNNRRHNSEFNGTCLFVVPGVC